MMNGVELYGGFAGGETLRSHRSVREHASILGGEIGAPGYADNSYHVVTSSDAAATAVLDGFTIRDGNADGGSYPYGGGLLIWGHLTVRNCHITANRTSNHGAGAAVQRMTPTTPEPLFVNSVIEGNTATYLGAAVWLAEAGARLVHCTVIGNTSSNPYYGAIHRTGTVGTPRIVNSIVRGNTAGYDIGADGNTSIAVEYSDVGTTTGPVAMGAGNINADPLYVNAAAGDLHLTADSPAVDAASSAEIPGNIITDRDGKPRRIDAPRGDTGNGTPPLPDMGAYEFMPVTVSAPPSRNVCAGATTTLPVTATGWGTLMYAWRKGSSPISDGGHLSGTGTATLTITGVDGTDAGSYDVVVTDSLGTQSISSAATVAVLALPTATLTGDATIDEGDSTGLSVALTGAAPWSVDWSDGFSQSGIASSPATRTVGPTTTTTYELSGVSDANCTGTFSGAATVTVIPAVIVSTVTPGSGPTSGGTSVTITGSGFHDGSTVTFGGTAATNVVVTSDTQITATTPPHAAGLVNVAVTRLDTRTGQLANAFTYYAPPAVTSVEPPEGPVAGGTSVSIHGSAFRDGAAVAFDGTPATAVVVVSESRIDATTPAHAAGTVGVAVTNIDGQSGALPSAFYYAPPPAVASVNPSSGPAAGGVSVTIEGSGFRTGASVTFGGSPATNVVVFGGTIITALTPPHLLGRVTVSVTNPDGQSASLENGYTYAAPPSITDVTPSFGPVEGGTVVTIRGAGFQSGATVAFGGVAATGVVVSDGATISAMSPPHAAGSVTVSVTNPDGQTGLRANAFTYYATSDATLTMGTGEVCDGGVVTIPVLFNGSVAPHALSFDVTFDAARLTAIEVVRGSLTSGFEQLTANTSSGRVRIAMASSSAAPAAFGEIARITLQGGPGLTAGGTAPISIAGALVDETVATGTPGTASCPMCTAGDPSGNGQITAFDASLVLQITVGAILPDAGQSCAGDFNGNGSITAYDASLILQCVVGSGPCS